MLKLRISRGRDGKFFRRDERVSEEGASSLASPHTATYLRLDSAAVVGGRAQEHLSHADLRVAPVFFLLRVQANQASWPGPRRLSKSETSCLLIPLRLKSLPVELGVATTRPLLK
jgi:hypothetical protein